MFARNRTGASGLAGFIQGQNQAVSIAGGEPGTPLPPLTGNEMNSTVVTMNDLVVTMNEA